MNEDVQGVLAQLAPSVILVGSAARGTQFKDIDLVLSRRQGVMGLAKKLLAPWDSAFMGSLTSKGLSIQVEVFEDWYGPDYWELTHKHSRELIVLRVLGVQLRAWPINTRTIR